MPDPNNYDNMADFMKDCMHETKAEGLEQKQRVGKCTGMWAGKGKKEKD